MLRHLDLFSGIGGFALAARMVGGYETVGFCEIEPYCQAVLRKHWPGMPIYDDIRNLSGRDTGPVDVITGGFPCQDVSLAGDRAGLAGARSGLWGEYRRLVCEIRPRFVVVENVPGLLSLGMGTVLGDLATIGYDAEWHCIPASTVGAPHRRDRVWIVAYPANESPEACMESLRAPKLSRQLGGVLGRARFPRVDQPPILRVDDGLYVDLDGHEALGNAIVPQVAAIFLQAIKDCAEMTEPAT